MQAVTDLRNYKTLQNENCDSVDQVFPNALHFVCNYLDITIGSRQFKKALSNFDKENVVTSTPVALAELGIEARPTRLSELSLDHNFLPLLVLTQDQELRLIPSLNTNQRCVVIDLNGKNTTRVTAFDNAVINACQVWELNHEENDFSLIDEEVEKKSIATLVSNHFREQRSTVITIMMAALVTNTLAMAGIVFSMQVYDRVIPAASYPTLYVLFIGVLVAICFDFIIKTLRVRLSDIFGRILGVQASDSAFLKVLGTPFQDIPKNSSKMVNKVRDVDQIKEMVGAATINVISDLPFFMLFVFVLWVIAGSLAFVPVVAVLFIIIPGLVMQPSLAKYSKQMMKDSAARNAFLNESMGSVLDIKLLQAERQYCDKWSYLNQKANESGIKFRQLIAGLGNWTSTVQMSVFAMVVLFGAPMVIDGGLSAGALVASSILASRMLSPMGNINQLLSRWQMAKGGARSFQDIIDMSSDTDKAVGKVNLPDLSGHIEMNRAEFKYHKDDHPALYVAKLNIKPGERVAVMGRSGSGKSTLLLALAGLLPATQGEINYDGIRLTSLSNDCLRSSVGLISQDSSLFCGSIRANITMGEKGYTDGEVLEAMDACGVLPMLGRFEKGLDHFVYEKGAGLSDGQKRMVIMARLALRNPKIMLLDEPLAHLDETVEKSVLDWLNAIDSDKTVIVTSHKPSVLQIVDRVIIVNDGRLIIDENKQEALKKIRQVRDSNHVKYHS